ncbi:MAG: glycogen/starch/alpha-glucan phosphorylase [Ruminococcaceae bacterium]|nr:glycogen/starch/alpha-glucan phosphorylase [Oscillospiraceae bacterium]
MKYTPNELKNRISATLSHNFGVSPEQASDELFYKATVLVLLGIMRERRTAFRKETEAKQAKMVYYLSMEFLMGRSLKNNLYNLELEEDMKTALSSFGVKLSQLYELEPDAGLGNGGLGRLAACFLDSLSSGSYPAMGYCIKYEFGIFRQKLVDGWQTEMPDFWLPGGSVWLEARPTSAVDVLFDGWVEEWWDGDYHHVELKDYTPVHAVPYDLMVAGNDGKAVNVLRLWSAETPFINMEDFNRGDYLRALEQQANCEVISKVLYPEDHHMEGKSLRLRQQYFLVSASIQDILRRHLRTYGTLDNLPEKAAIHINDTHPALVIPELMRHLLDECGYSWDTAFDIVSRTAAYTNHTVMSEALECWQCDLVKSRIPRIFDIITEIDNRHRAKVWEQTHDADYVERTAIISGGMVRMANLSVAVCHSVNGVSKLHSEILKDDLFNDYYRLTPEKFTNVTNGIAHRRWLCSANRGLTSFLTELIGDGFKRNTNELEKLKAFKDDKQVLNTLYDIKKANKERFAEYVKSNCGIILNTDSIFDMQVKRLHEYKRQHLNVMNIAAQYLALKNNPNMDFTPKTYIFGAKAAPGYMLAKHIIHMIYSLSQVVNNDPAVRDKLKIVFMEDYRVTLAELMIPSADVSEQISLAGTEASGTGNMKLMMNGAVTLGTEDGANVEIHKAVGDDNIIIFGMETPEVNRLKKIGYHPSEYYNNNPLIREVLDFLSSGLANDFRNVTEHIKNNDTYMALADFADYTRAQNTVSELYGDKDVWNRMSLMNIASSGIFSSDRSIDDYAKNIWDAKPLKD